MVGGRSARKLFHLALKIYFSMSLGLFLWYGNRIGYTPSDQDERSTEDAVSLQMTLLRNFNGETTDDDILKTLSDKQFFESIMHEEDYDKTENGKGTGIENYIENLSYDSDEVNFKGQNYYFEELNDDEIEKQELHNENAFGKELNGSSNINKNEQPKWLHIVKEQNRLYNNQLVQRVKDMDVFYISAVVADSTRDPKLARKGMSNTVAINGWLGRKNKKTGLYCCFKHHSTSVSSSEVFMKHIWDVPHIKVVTASQFICNASIDIDQQEEMYVGISGNPACKLVEYVKLEVEMKPPSSQNASFAVCGKIIYGNFSAPRLLEWFEINIAFGVDHFSLFTYNVTKEAKTVLNHYQKEGYLSFKEFDFPLKLRYPRYLGQKYMMAYMDEQVAVFDCVRRFNKYTYIAVVDVDEFIMPKAGHTNYKSMMDTLLTENPSAAGFTLMTSLFIVDWRKTHPEADFTVGQYTLRTLPMWDRRKSVIISDRVYLPSIWTHGFETKDIFRRVYLYKNKAVIHHYRKCRAHWIEADTCYNHRHQYQDASMKKFLSKVRNTLLYKRKLLLHY